MWAVERGGTVKACLGCHSHMALHWQADKACSPETPAAPCFTPAPLLRRGRASHAVAILLPQLLNAGWTLNPKPKPPGKPAPAPPTLPVLCCGCGARVRGGARLEADSAQQPLASIVRLQHYGVAQAAACRGGWK